MTRISAAMPQGPSANPNTVNARSRDVNSRFPAVQKLIAAINALPVRDRSQDAQTAEYVMQSLAHENGFQGLWTPEERAVGSAFITLRLGPRAAHYGWRLYKRYRATGAWDVDRVGY